MKFLVFLVLMLYLEFTCQKVLSEERELNTHLLDEQILNLDYKVYNETNRGFEQEHPKNADCRCEDGECVDGICTCPYGYGNYSSTRCLECNCGGYFGCYYKSSSVGQKVCLCTEGFNNNGKICVACECDFGSCDPEEGIYVCTCYPGYGHLGPNKCKECNCGPDSNCTFTFQGIWDGYKKNCICKTGYAEKNGKCVDCHCGKNSNFCSFDRKGKKSCHCSTGYAENQGYCEECNCGPYGSCMFDDGKKLCDCMPLAIEMNGVCVVRGTSSPSTTAMSTTSTTAKECNCGPYGSCSFENGQKKCHCESFATEMNGVCVVLPTTSSKGTTDSIIMSTLLSSTVQECDCGEYSYSCHFNWKGDKICSCISGYVELLGTCLGICSENTCVHGKCEMIGNNYKCRCNDGFTGQRCEEKIQINLNKQDLWLILILLVAFATFMLLFGMFCWQICFVKKRFNK